MRGNNFDLRALFLSPFSGVGSSPRPRPCLGFLRHTTSPAPETWCIHAGRRVSLVASPVPPPQASHSGVEAGAVDPVGCEEHVEELALSLEQGGHGELHRSPPFDAVVVRLGLLPAAEDAVEGFAGFRI